MSVRRRAMARALSAHVWLVALAAGIAMTACASSAPQGRREGAAAVAARAGGNDLLRWQQQVRATDLAFAATMAERKPKAFATFLADDAIFLSPQSLRGKAQIIAGWSAYFGRGAAPFSWDPARVEVLDNGTLALTAGPVRDSSGHIAGVYSSMWRRSGTDDWHIIFNVGTQTCSCAR